MKIVYDGECRLCLASKARVERWGRPFAWVDLRSPEARALLPGVSDDDLRGQMRVIEDGKVYAGAAGWKRILRKGPWWIAWLGRLTPLFVMSPVYAWIARHRYRWFGRVCDDACALSASGGKRSSTRSGSPGPS